jgi:hypothetical protein
VRCATLLLFFTYTLVNSQLRVILILLSDSDMTLLSLPGATTHRAVFLFRSTTSTSLSWEAGSAIGAVLFFPPLRADPVALQPVLVSDLSSLTWTVDCHWGTGAILSDTRPARTSCDRVLEMDATARPLPIKRPARTSWSLSLVEGHSTKSDSGLEWSLIGKAKGSIVELRLGCAT